MSQPRPWSAEIRIDITILCQHVNSCKLLQDQAAVTHLVIHGAHLPRHRVHVATAAADANSQVHVAAVVVYSSTGLCGVLRLGLLGVHTVAGGDISRLRPSAEIGTRLVAVGSSLVGSLGLGLALVLLHHRALNLPHPRGQKWALWGGSSTWEA